MIPAPYQKPVHAAALESCASLVLGLTAALGCLGAGCAREAESPRTWPPGTVFALGAVPITAEEIDRAGDIVARIEPDSVPARIRRIALTNVVLPRAAGIGLSGPKREEARARALECKQMLDAGLALWGPLTDILVQTREGGAVAIGFDAFGYASDAEIGRWSAPIETVGCFEIVRVDERSQAPSPRDQKFKVQVYIIPYVDGNDPRGAIETCLDRSKLEFVDPSWSDIVPEYWKHRLRGGSP